MDERQSRDPLWGVLISLHLRGVMGVQFESPLPELNRLLLLSDSGLFVSSVTAEPFTAPNICSAVGAKSSSTLLSRGACSKFSLFLEASGLLGAQVSSLLVVRLFLSSERAAGRWLRSFSLRLPFRETEGLGGGGAVVGVWEGGMRRSVVEVLRPLSRTRLQHNAN